MLFAVVGVGGVVVAVVLVALLVSVRPLSSAVAFVISSVMVDGVLLASRFGVLCVVDDIVVVNVVALRLFFHFCSPYKK